MGISNARVACEDEVCRPKARPKWQRIHVGWYMGVLAWPVNPVGVRSTGEALVLYINIIRMFVCLSVCLDVCVSTNFKEFNPIGFKM